MIQQKRGMAKSTLVSEAEDPAAIVEEAVEDQKGAVPQKPVHQDERTLLSAREGDSESRRRRRPILKIPIPTKKGQTFKPKPPTPPPNPTLTIPPHIHKWTACRHRWEAEMA